MELMLFTVIHLAGTYILKHIIKIPQKLTNQTLILQSVTQILIELCIFKSYRNCCTPCLTDTLKDATCIYLISSNCFPLQNFIANGKAESEFYQLPDFRELFADELHFSL